MKYESEREEKMCEGLRQFDSRMTSWPGSSAELDGRATLLPVAQAETGV